MDQTLNTLQNFHRPSRKRGPSRGVASIEALLVLMTLLIVWAGVNYMGRLLEAQLDAKAEARSCAWQVSLSACQNIPPECRMEEHNDDEASGSTDKTKKLSQTNEDTQSGETEMGDFNDAMSAEVDGLFKKRVSLSSSRNVPGSPLLKFEEGTLHSSYSLPCNTRKQTISGMVEDLVKKFLSR
jgi:hypothetical protein